MNKQKKIIRLAKEIRARYPDDAITEAFVQVAESRFVDNAMWGSFPRCANEDGGGLPFEPEEGE